MGSTIPSWLSIDMAPLPETPEDTIMIAVRDKLQALFTSVGMPESHGMAHCLVVLGHMEKAISAADPTVIKNLTSQKIFTLRLASLLHEADDHKYFKNSTNVKDILEDALPGNENKVKIISDVEEMISYVSASANGNSVPPGARADPTLLWPRFCDRLEAIGVVGAVRCYQYNRETTAPLMLDTTPRPGSEQEMMDHYYDKLLQIAHFDPAVVCNAYLQEVASDRVRPLVEICLEYGRTGEVPVQMLEKFEKELIK